MGKKVTNKPFISFLNPLRWTKSNSHPTEGNKGRKWAYPLVYIATFHLCCFFQLLLERQGVWRVVCYLLSLPLPSWSSYPSSSATFKRLGQVSLLQLPCPLQRNGTLRYEGRSHRGTQKLRGCQAPTNQMAGRLFLTVAVGRRAAKVTPNMSGLTCRPQKATSDNYYTANTGKLNCLLSFVHSQLRRGKKGLVRHIILEM